MWNDDFHHSAIAALTGRREAYYTDYQASPQEFISAAKYRYLYQGQRYKWQKKRRSTPATGGPPSHQNFVTFLQNHDQVANTARGARPNTLSNPALYRAMTALLILSPGTPMLFQGTGSSALHAIPVLCDHDQELCANVRKGRAQFLAQFRSLAQPELQETLPDPGDHASAFQNSKLDPDERRTTTLLTIFIRNCCACDAGIPCFRTSGAAESMARYFRIMRSSCATSAPSTETASSS